MEGGGANIFYIEGGDKRFYIKEWTNIYVGGSGGYDDVDDEEEILGVSVANFLVSKTNFLVSGASILVSKESKLFAGARISRGP